MNNKYSLPKDGGLIAESTPRDIIIVTRKFTRRSMKTNIWAFSTLPTPSSRRSAPTTNSTVRTKSTKSSSPSCWALPRAARPLGLYPRAGETHKEGLVSFRNVAVFSLDEFYPIRSTEQQSRNFRIHEDFLNHIDILPENIHIPGRHHLRGQGFGVLAPRTTIRCARSTCDYRRGEDGQIGFNEPGSYAKSRTRLVR